jgi:mono/diheme cytochrome c family protein
VKQAKPRPENVLPFKMKMLFTMIGVQLHEPVKSVAMPDKKDKVAYGRYVALAASCTDCHSLGEKGPAKEDDPLFMAGSTQPFEDPAVGRIWSRNLTPDPETGLGKYSAEQIKHAIRTGTRLDGHKMAPPMSIMIAHYTGMSDEDLDGVVAYLKSLKPAKRAVPERELSPAIAAAFP